MFYSDCASQTCTQTWRSFETLHSGERSHANASAYPRGAKTSSSGFRSGLALDKAPMFPQGCSNQAPLFTPHHIYMYLRGRTCYLPSHVQNPPNFNHSLSLTHNKSCERASHDRYYCAYITNINNLPLGTEEMRNAKQK